MTLNLANYIESILNPNGRFKTLDGVYPIKDDEGEPRMALTDTSVNFEAVYNGDNCVLKCFLDDDPSRKKELMELSIYTWNIDCPYIVPHIYLENEMLVFDNADRPTYVDVVIQKMPEGERLDNYLKIHTRKKNTAKLSALLESLGNMPEWFAANNFSHNDICARNIFVSSDSQPILVNYNKGSRKRSQKDIKAIGAMTAAIYIAACQPELYIYFIHNKTFSLSGMRKLAGLIKDFMSDEDADALKDVLDMIITREEVSDHNLCKSIKRLSLTEPKSYEALKRIATHLRGEVKTKSEKDRIKYSFIGEMQDMVMRVFDGDGWFYIDKKGEVVIPGKFVNAWDFSEGRAVVETKDGYALIDLDGNYIIEPKCADIEWDSMNNIAIVTIEGMSGIYSREGGQVTGLIYDHILNCSEGLLPVKKNGKYGFIQKDGTVVIEPMYDDAFSFRDGFARVRLGNRNRLIDKTGKTIDEIVGR